jgi:hypothetical protein
MRLKLYVFIFVCWFSIASSFGQERPLMEEELENFLLLTDRDLYLSGDRVWFAAKLLKNHESYRYSKLAYITVLDAEGKSVHQEKMLLTGQDMIYGDMFIPETAQSGVFSILVHTKWMANFENFPISKKKFLVVNPNSPKPGGEPALFWEQVPFENAPVSIFHTSDRPEVIEIQDKSGNTLEIMEAVVPLQKTLSSVRPTGEYKLVFRNAEHLISPQRYLWDPSDFSLSTRGVSEKLRIVTHTDWMVLEELVLDGEKIGLNKGLYQTLNSFNISVINDLGESIWSYQVQLPAKNPGQLQLNSKGKAGEGMKLELSGFSAQLKTGLIWASADSDPRVSDLAEILNHPNWRNLSTEGNRSNLIASLGKKVESPLLLKDYSPMFDYKPWSVDMGTRFKSAVKPDGVRFSLPEDLTRVLVDRRIYQEHFEIGEQVVELQSPFAPDKVYKLEDYDEFPDFESLVKEIIPQIRLKKSKSGTGKEVFVANTDNQHVKFDKKPLILIDFYRPASMEEVWKIDMTTLDRIELYYHRASTEATNLGEAVGDGLIVLYTKNNGYFLKNNVPKSRYFLADVSVPRRPDYSNRLAKTVSGNPLQFMEANLRIDRGRGKVDNLRFDTAGSWIVETWVFGNSDFERVQKRIQIDP